MNLKNMKRMFSLFLCLVIISSTGIIPNKVNAAENEIKKITIKETIKIGDQQLEIIATVKYDSSNIIIDTDNDIISDEFEKYDVFEDGEFSRVKLGKLVFENPELKKKLENILHPQIREEIKKFFEQNKDEKYLFVGIPLLFEANMTDLFDKIIFVYTNDEIRLKRLLLRNGYTLDYAKARINSQMRQEEKAQKSDYVINNNGSIEELNHQLIKLFEQIR